MRLRAARPVDRAVVGVGEPARVTAPLREGRREPGAVRRAGRGGRTIEAVDAQEAVAAGEVGREADIALAGAVVLEAEPDELIDRVPVAPGLAHRQRLLGLQPREPV